MTDVSLVALQGQLVLLLAIGMAARKLKVFDESATSLLTDLLLVIALPASIIQSFQIEFSKGLLTTFLLVLGISTLTQIISYLFSLIFFRSRETAKRKTLRYGLIVANSGFLGLPIAGEVFGPVGYIYASIFLIPLRVMMWTVGLSIFNNETTDRGEQIKKVVLHPCMVAVYIGFVLLFTGITLPKAVTNTLDALGGMTTALSMLVIGSLFGAMGKEHLALDKDLWLFSLLRLGVLPLLAFWIAKVVGADPILIGVAVVMTGMPASSTTAILAAKYDGDGIYGSKLLLLSIALSLISIPLWLLYI